LRGQGLVRRQHQRRTAAAGDDIGHGVGLARAGDAQQGLEREAVGESGEQLLDRRRLVAGRQEGLMEAEGAAREGDHRVLLFGRLDGG